MGNEKQGGSSAGSWLIGSLATLVFILFILIAHGLIQDRKKSVPFFTHSPRVDQVSAPLLEDSVTLAPVIPPLTTVHDTDGEEWAQWATEGYRDFERGHYSEAVAAYRRAVSLNPSEDIIRRNLAYALAQAANGHLQSKQFSQAREGFQQAILHEEHPAFKQGLGVALYHVGEEEGAVIAFEEAIRLDPKMVTSYIYLGQIYYRRDEMTKALERLERATQLEPLDAQLQAFYEKVKRGHALQSDFRKKGTPHFTILFEGDENEELTEVVREVLESAYHEIGGVLSTYPERPITVVLYSQTAFQESAHGPLSPPSWVGGLYDGKIHLPVGGGLHRVASLHGILYHEYTHALVHQIAKQKVPTWLNEGLAETFETNVTGRLHRFQPSDEIVPLESLHGSFMEFDKSKALLAYAESASAVGYLVDRYGYFRMRILLEQLETKPFPDAFEEAFLITYPAFQKEWQRTLGTP